MWYLIALAVMIVLYVAVLFLMKYMKNKKITNLIFVLIISTCYIFNAILIYLDVGFYDWNFQNVLPVANVSPFMFTILPFIFLLPRKIRPYLLTLISILSIGMFLSTVFSCVMNFARDYMFHFSFLLDFIAHFTISLLGIYLVLTGQAKITKKSVLIAFAIIFGVAILMVILNLIFNTAFFGLSLRGKHNIYNMVLVESSLLSTVLYFAGLAVVLCIGTLVQRGVVKKQFN